jgi:hypothetical protein
MTRATVLAPLVADQLVDDGSDADENEDEYHQDAEPNADSDSDSDKGHPLGGGVPTLMRNDAPTH